MAIYGSVLYGASVYGGGLAGEAKFFAGGLTMSVDLWIATIANDLVTDISSSLIDGSVDLNMDRTIKLAATFTIRNPSQVRPYADFLAPFLRLEYDDGSPTRYQQLGLYAIETPPGTSTIEAAVGTFAGSEITSVLASHVFSDAYNISAATNARGAIRTIIVAAGIGASRFVMPPIARNISAANRTYPAGTTRLAAINQILQSVSNYDLGMDLDGKVSTPGFFHPLTSRGFYRTLTDADVMSAIETVAPPLPPSNVIVAVSQDDNQAPIKSVARNDDPASVTSTVQMGREMSPSDSPLKPQGPMTQADLDAYTARVLSERRTFYSVIKLSTLPDPLALAAHRVVRLNLTGNNAKFNGKWWLRLASIGLAPANALTTMTLNRVTSDLTGRVI